MNEVFNEIVKVRNSKRMVHSMNTHLFEECNDKKDRCKEICLQEEVGSAGYHCQGQQSITNA